MVHTMELRVEGKNQLVTLSEIVHPVHCMFHAELEDGYENIFFADVETGWWVEQDLGYTYLADQIGEAVQGLNHHFHSVRKYLNWYNNYHHNKHICFGYFRDESDGYQLYEIFAANRRYMFTLVKLNTDVWQLFKLPGSGWDYDDEYIQEIPFILDACQM